MKNNAEKMMVFDLIEKLIKKGVILRIEKIDSKFFDSEIRVTGDLCGWDETKQADTLANALKALCVSVDIPIEEAGIPATENVLAYCVRSLEPSKPDRSPEFYEGIEALAQLLASKGFDN